MEAIFTFECNVFTARALHHMILDADNLPILLIFYSAACAFFFLSFPITLNTSNLTRETGKPELSIYVQRSYVSNS